MFGSAHSRHLSLLIGVLVWFSPAITPAQQIGSHGTNFPVASQQLESRPSQKHRLTIKVTDENGGPVASALITLEQSAQRVALTGQTDYSGSCQFQEVEPGIYQLRVEKEGFFASITDGVSVTEPLAVEIRLNHQQEFAETVDVVDSPKRIDPAQTAISQGLDYKDILNLPYPTTRDIRFALPFIPGVLADPTAQIHVNGSETYQVFDQLDGFNITDPVSGLFQMRVSTDALRSIEILSGRYSAEYGKGSGGVVSLNTGMGDDRLRFSATNFVPTVQSRRGLNLNDWTPRATISGPIKRDRAWFFEATDAEYKLNIVRELPEGQDRSSSWRWSSLTRGQVNLAQSNILTAGFLINKQHAGNAGLSRFDPLETTRDEKGSAYLLTVKDQAYLANRTLLEVGLGFSQYRTDETPQGSLPYFVRPEGTSGNFFETARGLSRRLQMIANVTFAGFQWHGDHELRLGTDVDRITSDQFFNRRDIFVLREDGTLSRRISFNNSPRFDKNNLELSSFVQDRWSVSDRLLLESGLRLDWDEIIKGVAVSPRLSATYMLDRERRTKLSAGIGLFHDPTNLELVTRPLAGERLDYFFEDDGQTLIGPPIETSFEVVEQTLAMPRFINWSIGVERKLPGEVYLQLNFLQKRGYDGFAFENMAGSAIDQSQNHFVFRQNRQDRYDSLEVTARKSFRTGYSLFASYVRSSARSNAVLDFTLNNLIIAQQAGGPLAWDAPNRLLSWGWLPLIKGFDFAYSLDWRDGYPFSVVNQDQELVGAPNSRRFPAFFSLNTHIERRFKLFGAQWSVRAGFNNITSRENPTGVNNNIDSPDFLTFGGTQHRVFTGRIRFLGRK